MRSAAFALVLCLSAASPGLAQAGSAPVEERGRYATYSLLHEIGSETYAVTPGPQGSVMTVAATLSDRGTTRSSNWTLKMGAGYAPTFLEQTRAGVPADEVWRTQVDAGSVTVEEPGGRRVFAKPHVAYVGY